MLNFLKRRKFPLLFILFLIFTLYFFRGFWFPLFFQPQQPKGVDVGKNNGEVFVEEIEVVAENLVAPWEIVFLSENEFLITERGGFVLHFFEKELKNKFEIEDVVEVGEGGLLGVTLHPNFEENSFVYLYFTTGTLLNTKNKVVRYVFNGEEFSKDKIILDDIPGAQIHNGGRIAFGPDGYLYLTTGDAGKTELAQDLDSLAGKILRITDEGAVPEDNPFNTLIYSYGHRNPQGLTWDTEGRLWSTEHGPSARDELNFIQPGKNYGWPEIRGDEEQEGMEKPVLISGEDYTWAPSGMTFFEENIYFAGLRGQAIYEVKLAGVDVLEFNIHFEQDFGRLRSVNL